jgi:glycosyltransferase involved in cell wall biosynthesis
MTKSPQDDRPGLAMIVNVLAPYRINLHSLIAAGIPELKLHTLVTHGPADFDWDMTVPKSINASYFGAKGDSPLASTFHRPLYEWRKGGRLINYIRSNNIAAVITLGYRYISYLRTIHYCHQSGLPLFVHNDSNIQGDRSMSAAKSWAKKQVYGWWLRRSSGVMSMGEYGDQFFIRYGADSKRIYRVPLTPNFENFSEVDLQQLRRFCADFGLVPDRQRFVFSGRLVHLKRVDLIVDAFAAIAAERPDWDLLIVGDGELGDELRRRVPDALRSRVVWTGFLDREETALAYHAADVLVLASNREPWSLVVLEAMAAGLVVVSSDIVGAAHELITDGVSGRLFSVDSLAELVRALLDVSDLGATSRYKRNSILALKQWREKTDPVSEVRRAFIDCGVLSVQRQDVDAGLSVFE